MIGREAKCQIIYILVQRIDGNNEDKDEDAGRGMNG
jgi:hypothetical protein